MRSPELDERLIRAPARQRAALIRNQAIAAAGAYESHLDLLDDDLIAAHANAVIRAWQRLTPAENPPQDTTPA